MSSVAYYKKKRGPLKEEFKISQEVKVELQNTEVWEEADHPKEISFYKFWFHFWLVVWPQVNYLIALDISFFLWKMMELAQLILFSPYAWVKPVLLLLAS